MLKIYIKITERYKNIYSLSPVYVMCIMTDICLETIANSIYPTKDFRVSFEKEIKDEEGKGLIKKYFKILGDVSKGLTYENMINSSKKINFLSKCILFINRVRKKHHQNLRENIIECTKLEKEIDEYLVENYNSLNKSWDNFYETEGKINHLIGCYPYLLYD